VRAAEYAPRGPFRLLERRHGFIGLRVGESHELTLRISLAYGETLYKADGATLDDHREAVKMLKETERTSRRVLGGAHPMTAMLQRHLKTSRAALNARSA